jgi:hypothetical protein
MARLHPDRPELRSIGLQELKKDMIFAQLQRYENMTSLNPLLNS